jgi:hypothetical protein
VVACNLYARLILRATIAHAILFLAALAAGHRLQIPIGEFAAPTDRRGAGRKYQVEGLGGLLHHPDLHLRGHRRPKLLLYGRLGVLEELWRKASS